ncbi:uncharacterized protein LOC125648220 isoform X2 [Ostrea edulis]|uniref:uncharacterized protein LOC125648220 isoform X2 n=1 Tax=Ostrea edulis TaxID=37623 RepID=UPI0024AF4743|nr:uncharacterized protein LOC125648220 isoform X2 [Ostrea edulis]
MSDRGLVVCIIVFLFIPTCALQLSGIFSSWWVKTEAPNITSECYLGVIFNENCWNYIEYTPGIVGIGQPVTGLEILAGIVMALTTLNALISFRYSDDDSDDDFSCCRCIIGCVSIFYPFSGILGFTGCMFLVSYDLGELQWAFYTSLAASCYNIIQIFFCCWMLCKVRRHEEEETNETSTGAIVIEQLQITQVTHIFHIT